MASVTGTAFNPDTNLGNINGTGYVVRPLGGDSADAAIGNYTRQGSCVKYLYPHRDRSNLEVVDRAVVLNVDKKGSCGNHNEVCVNQVTYLRDGELTNARINRNGKIILTAGFYNTPKILLHSGIGDCDELAALEIPCTYNNTNVGKRTHNHVLIAQIYAGGPSPNWTSHRGSIVATYYSANRTTDEINIETTYTSYPSPISPAHVILVSNTLTSPYSTGYLRLKSKNWGDDVEVKFGILDDARDVAPLVTAFKNARRAASNLGLVEVSPGSSVASDTQIIANIRSNIRTIYHPTGSARMGVCGGDAVVDSELNVCGVKNLMVADNSVWPESYYGHTTHTGALMIAGRAAQYVLAQY